MEAIEGVCEREDLRGTGFVEKYLVVDIISKYLGEKQEMVVDEKLVVNDEINYVRLLSEEYLRAGGKIREWLMGHFANRIVRVVREVGALKKRRKRKERRPERVGKKK